MLGRAAGISVIFDEPVRVTGSPQLMVEVGSQKRNLDILHVHFPFPYHTPVKGIRFEYYVQASDVGSIVATGIDLNGGTITSAKTGEAANLVFEKTPINYTHNGLPLTVDGRRRLTPNHLMRGSCELRPNYDNLNGLDNYPTDGNTYRAEDKFYMEVYCPVALTVTGTPQVSLVIGARTRYADYVPALSNASILIFSYTVQKADFDSDGIQYGGPTPWRMNGGSVVPRGYETQANLLGISYTTVLLTIGGLEKPANVDGGGSGTSPGGSGANLVAAPLVRTVTFDTSPRYERTYRLDEQIPVAVRFTVPVTVTGTPQIGLTIGSQTRQAAYAASRSAVAHQPLGLAPGSILVFTYTIQETDADADGISIAANALALNGGTINRASDTTIAASLGHDVVGADATRKVNGRLRMPPKLNLPRGIPAVGRIRAAGTIPAPVCG